MLSRRHAWPLLFGLLGCGTYAGDVEALCEAGPATSAKATQAKADPTQRRAILMAEFEDRMKTSKGRKLAADVRAMSDRPDEVEAAVRKAMAEASVPECGSLRDLKAAAKFESLGKEVRMICAPEGELAEKLRGLHERPARLALLHSYLDEHVKTFEGRQLLQQIRDPSIPADDRLKAANLAASDHNLSSGTCAYAADIAAAGD